MEKLKRSLIFFILLLSFSTFSRNWENHDAPFDFLFGNKIDKSQETKLNKDGNLFGFLYAIPTGEYTEDGIQILKHCKSKKDSLKTPVAGWIMRGIPIKATFVYHDKDFPVWLVKDKSIIPQPGSYSYFHWTGNPSGCMELTEGQEYDGYLIELHAITKFVYKHCGKMIKIKPGLDNVSHLNIVTSYPGYDTKSCCTHEKDGNMCKHKSEGGGMDMGGMNMDNDMKSMDNSADY